jgi:hypothetical protein
MSTKEKIVEKERKAVLALLLQKNRSDIQRSRKCTSRNVDGGKYWLVIRAGKTHVS